MNSAVAGYAPASFAAESHFYFLKRRRGELEDGVPLPYIRGRVRVGGTDNGVARAGEILLLAEGRELEGVEEAGGDKAELARHAESRPVDVAGDGQAGVSMNVVHGRGDVHIRRAQQHPPVYAEDVFVFVHDDLVAEPLRVVLARLEPLIYFALHLADVGRRREEREDVDFLGGGNFYSGDYDDAGFFAQPNRRQRVFGGVVVGEADNGEAAPSSGLDDASRRLLEVAAGGENGMDVQVGAEGTQTAQRSIPLTPIL